MLDQETSVVRGAARPAATGGPRGPTENLKDIGARLRKALNDGEQSEMRVGVEVSRLADRWEDHRDEAGGLEIDKWLRANVDPTRTLAWYRERAKAADWIKPTGMRERLAPDLVVWMMHKMNEADRDAAIGALDKAWREQGRMPLKLSQGRLLLSRFTVRGRSKQRLGEKIKALEAHVGRLQAQVREMGGEPVE